MKTNKTINVMLVLTLAISLFQSCKQREETIDEMPVADEKEVEVQSTDDNSQSDEMYTHVYTVVHTEVSNVEEQSFKTEEASGPAPDPCALKTYVVDSTVKVNKFIKKMVIDYGTSGCTWEGRTRKGKIIITKTKKMSAVGNVTTITYDNFYIDGNKIEGTSTLTNNGFDGGFNLTYTLVGGKITFADGSTTTWEAQRKMQFFSLSGSAKMYMSGSSSGVNRMGVSYTVNITKDLFYENGCKHPKAGTMQIETAGKPAVTIDFGDGSTCADKAVMTMNKKKYKKVLR